MNVAIPKLNNSIAACFDVAKQFEITEVKNRKVLSAKIVDCSGDEGFKRVRLLRMHEVDILICNGIKNFYKDLLSAINVRVIPNIDDDIQHALNDFLSGKLRETQEKKSNSGVGELVSHDSLVDWARDYFEWYGYEVFDCREHESSLIDLKAQIHCPVCGKLLEVAICCGAQTYRVDQEIKEFHHNSKMSFPARVYINSFNPLIAKSCDDYGINFIAPEKVDLEERKTAENVIPILQKPVEAHEKAFAQNQ